jgi:hypothetical protein
MDAPIVRYLHGCRGHIQFLALASESKTALVSDSRVASITVGMPRVAHAAPLSRRH